MRYLHSVLFGATFLGTSNCFVVSPSDPPQCNFAMPKSLTIGTMVPLCVYIMSAPVGNPTSSTYEPPQIKSIGFGVPLDEYAMLALSSSYTSFNHPSSDQDNIYAWMTGGPTSTGWPRECALNDGTPPTWTDIQTGAVYSCPQLVMTVNQVVPVASLVAIVEEGVLVNLIWDNSCQTCPVTSEQCIAGNLSLMLAAASTTQDYLTANPSSKITDNRICGVPHSDCLPTNSTGINCDFRVLLTWQGTDANGKRLTSSTLRLSQFSGQSVGSMWDSVANSFDPEEGINSENIENVR